MLRSLAVLKLKVMELHLEMVDRVFKSSSKLVDMRTLDWLLRPSVRPCRRQGTKAIKQRQVDCGHVATRDEHSQGTYIVARSYKVPKPLPTR